MALSRDQKHMDKTSARLPKEQISKAVERLSQAKEYKPDFSPISPQRTMAKNQMDLSVDRLYTQAINKHDSEMSKLLKEHRPTASPKCVSPDQLQESVRRLYNEGVKNKEKARQGLRTQFLAKPSSTRDKMSKEEIENCNSRVYNAAVQKKQDADAKGEARYILGSLPTFPQRTSAELKATAERLSTSRQ